MHAILTERVFLTLSVLPGTPGRNGSPTATAGNSYTGSLAKKKPQEPSRRRRNGERRRKGELKKRRRRTEEKKYKKSYDYIIINV